MKQGVNYLTFLLSVIFICSLSIQGITQEIREIPSVSDERVEEGINLEGHEGMLSQHLRALQEMIQPLEELLAQQEAAVMEPFLEQLQQRVAAAMVGIEDTVAKTRDIPDAAQQLEVLIEQIITVLERNRGTPDVGKRSMISTQLKKFNNLKKELNKVIDIRNY